MIHWKGWCWSWNSNTLATWCEELVHWKRPWCWERLRARGEGDNRGWDGWMAPPTRWTWVWASSGSWWWTGKPGMLQSMGWQRVRHDWVTELNHGSGLTQGYFILIFPFPRREPVGLRLFLAKCRRNGDGYLGLQPHCTRDCFFHPHLSRLLSHLSSSHPNLSHVGCGCGSIFII